MERNGITEEQKESLEKRFDTYIKQTLHRQAQREVRRLKKQKREIPMDLSELVIMAGMTPRCECINIFSDDEISELLKNMKRRKFAQELSKLNRKKKQILILEIQDYNNRDIAKALGIAESSVRVIKSRAKKQIRENVRYEDE